MEFIENNIYHIYNQGNNRQKIFFNYENKILFLKKIRKHILPYADIMAWCLMPNHFHLMIYVNNVIPEDELIYKLSDEESKIGTADTDITESAASRQTQAVTMESDAKRLTHADKIIESDEKRLTHADKSKIVTAATRQTQFLKNHCSKDHNLNYSIGIMLSSYTQAVNKQQKRTGSLFRPNTKSECVTANTGISPSFFSVTGATLMNRHFTENEYPKVCFDYIHNNPVRAGLVQNPEDWEFSSFRDVYGLRNGKLINRDRIEEYGLR